MAIKELDTDTKDMTTNWDNYSKIYAVKNNIINSGLAQICGT